VYSTTLLLGEALEEERRVSPGAYDEFEVIHLGSGMPATRFTRLIGVPDRSYGSWQARKRREQPVKGSPCSRRTPASDRSLEKPLEAP
jgi:hypothetical protein